ncbi:vitamin B12-dependent ribonucleotide reductase [candidate division KSB1 bacterium]|nr:vitamin B12-dependent ribonucleotide reductase [candidate division KSB1 bacterium]
MKKTTEPDQLGLEMAEQNAPAVHRGKLHIPRFFTEPGVHPYDQIEWTQRTASITNDKGQVLFELKGIETPIFWSQTAVNIVASKYFHLTDDKGLTPEKSIKQLIDRVVSTLTEWGCKDGYFTDQQQAETFSSELTHLLVHQKAAFNSPVWFNMGIEKEPQCSACFINSVEDRMDSILDLAKTEGMLFKFGSGTGTNFSSLRSSRERLASGGIASGPVSFMRGYDAFAGVIKSGGKTRRAAKMVILNIDHPDIEEFIRIKAHEEKKAWALIDSGYDGSFGGEAYNSVFFQNSNNSVRVTDDFMQAVQTDDEWHTRAVTDGKTMDTYKARHLFDEMAQAAHICGDPGIQFDTTINSWHTCPNSAPINSSNPCSEYMFVDDSACNLASLNLMRFVKENGDLHYTAFRRAVHVMIVAQELIVGNSHYPTHAITDNSHLFRPLGLGYANLGALLMYYGLPYDSDAGRALAATLTALMTGQAYLSSAVLASCVGPFQEFQKNRTPMMQVLRKHQNALKKINRDLLPPALFEAAEQAWADAVETGERYGFRNAQTTVLAPTGTIGFMMDCDTTGVEPDIALVKYKKLSGGGDIKLINQTVSPALKRLGYTREQIDEILTFIQKNDTIEGAPHLSEDHLPVFDCAFKPARGQRSIPYMGHIRMMGAVQPFLSGAISKTVNMPNDVTSQDISETYLKAWELGLKSIAIYRDGSKRTQPLNTGKKETFPFDKQIEQAIAKSGGKRHRLPDERRAWTHKFSIGGHDGYITVGEYENAMPGEIFIVMAKEGSFVSGLMDSFSTAISIGLQYGVPLKVFVDKFSHTRFEPYGFTNNAHIPIAKSISDYIFRWLEDKYLKGNKSSHDREEGITEQLFQKSDAASPETKEGDSSRDLFLRQEDAPPCHSCGTIMVRNGSCYKCLNCGETSGCS